MVDLKTVAVSVVAVLSAFLQLGIRAQSTIGSSSKDDSCSQLEEELEFELMGNMHLRSLLESKQQKIETLENERSRLRARELQSVTATVIKTWNILMNNRGIAKVGDRIYILGLSPVRFRVYEDQNDFRFIKEFSLKEIGSPGDIVYSNESKCVYISDFIKNCIWVMTTKGEHRLTKWLNNVTRPDTLSMSNEGHLLVLGEAQSLTQLEIYSLNATLIRRLQLPLDIKAPEHVVQTSDGNFIILHRLNTSSGQWVISQLTNDGQLIHRFIPRNQSEELDSPSHLSLDSDNNRLFVADTSNKRVILFDSSDLSWGQVLVSKELNGDRFPYRLFYDASKKYLFVAQYVHEAIIFEIN